MCFLLVANKLSENRGQETGVVQLAPRKKKLGYIPTEPWLSCCGAGSVGFVLNVFGGISCKIQQIFEDIMKIIHKKSVGYVLVLFVLIC